MASIKVCLITSDQKVLPLLRTTQNNFSMFEGQLFSSLNILFYKLNVQGSCPCELNGSDTGSSSNVFLCLILHRSPEIDSTANRY